MLFSNVHHHLREMWRQSCPGGSPMQKSHADEVCDRCSNFHWEKLMLSPIEQLMIAEDVETLESSGCHICRLFAVALKGQNSRPGPYILKQSFHRDPPEFGSSLSRHDFSMSTELLPGILSFNRSHSPNLLITRKPVEQGWPHSRYLLTQQVHDDQIRSWVEDCESTHSEYCAQDRGNRSRLENLRVIDCMTQTVVLAPLDCNYVALSYVWGAAFDHQHDHPASLKHPPATISHAINFTLRMGYKYLWIDRYCIDQMDAEDKHGQVSQMGDIYAAAEFTIVAAAGFDPHHGLPGVAPQSRPSLRQQKVGSVFLSQAPRVRGITEAARSKWASRAWTFQEFFRSRRRLIFTDHQVIFVCNHDIRYEIALPLIDLERTPQEEGDDDLLHEWLPYAAISNSYGRGRYTYEPLDAMDRAKRYLASYTRRQLSFDSDALSAIRGALESLESEAVYHVWGAPVQVGGNSDLSVFPPGGYHPRIRFDTSRSVSEHLQQPECEVSLGHQNSNPIPSTSMHQEVPGPRHSSSIGSAQVDIALMWYHKRACRHRGDFPTWSPIAWSGPIEWFRDSSVQEDHAPGVDGSSHCDWGLMSQLVATSTPFTNETTRYLQIQLRTAELELTESSPEHRVWDEDNDLDMAISSAEDIEEKGLGVAISVDQDVKVAFRPYWDVNEWLLSSDVHLKGALIYGTENSTDPRVRRKYPGIFLMILSPVREGNSNSYQRVGISRLPLPHHLVLGTNQFQKVLSKTTSKDLDYAEVQEAIPSIMSWSWQKWETIFTDYEAIQIV